MTKILIHDNNFLLLDEPTNHLDIHSKEMLLQSLKKYAGTILFVSHDQDFINKLATRIIELTPDGANSYHGNYDDYINQKHQLEQKTAPEKKQKVKKEKPNKESFEKQKETRRHEQKLNKLEKQMSKISEELEKLVYKSEEFNNTYQKLLSVEKEYNDLFELWEKLQ